jgi:hypothetical protein
MLSLVLSGQDMCPFNQATYEGRQAEAYMLDVTAPDRGVVIRVRSGITGIDYEFLVNAGEGYSTATLGTLRPDASVTPIPIYAFTDDMDWLGEFPKGDDPAPRYLAAPELGKTLWYQAEQLGGPSLASGQRENLPRTFFVLKECRQA